MVLLWARKNTLVLGELKGIYGVFEREDLTKTLLY